MACGTENIYVVVLPGDSWMRMLYFASQTLDRDPILLCRSQSVITLESVTDLIFSCF